MHLAEHAHPPFSDARLKVHFLSLSIDCAPKSQSRLPERDFCELLCPKASTYMDAGVSFVLGQAVKTNGKQPDVPAGKPQRSLLRPSY